jgi:hypothetical protein
LGGLAGVVEQVEIGGEGRQCGAGFPDTEGFGIAGVGAVNKQEQAEQ